MNNKTYEFFAKLIFEKTGMHYTETEYYRLEKRIKDLQANFECGTIEICH